MIHEKRVEVGRGSVEGTKTVRENIDLIKTGEDSCARLVDCTHDHPPFPGEVLQQLDTLFCRAAV